jgi:hypothetical protein
MNILQITELLKLRGITQLPQGTSAGMMIEQTGGQPSLSELNKVNQNVISLLITQKGELKKEIDTLKEERQENEKRLNLLTAFEFGGVDNWEGYDISIEAWEENYPNQPIR